MKEFEIDEGDEFFEQDLGESVIPADSDENYWIERQELLAKVVAEIEKRIKNNNLSRCEITFTFPTPEGIDNYQCIQWDIHD